MYEKIYALTSGSGYWSVPSFCSYVDMLIVGGGGHGADGLVNNAGGGGAGGVFTTGLTVTPNGSFFYSVGTAAQDTQFGDFIALAGGAGGVSTAGYVIEPTGKSGGCGGGGGYWASGGGAGGLALQPTSATGGYGCSGGIGTSTAGGGGGGATAPGGNGIGGNNKIGGYGGSGYDASSVFGSRYGVNGRFAGGGPGGGINKMGSGIDGSTSTSGIANTGAGGAASSVGGYDGGTGIILLKYVEPYLISRKIAYDNLTFFNNANIVVSGENLNNLRFCLNNTAGSNWNEITVTYNAGSTIATGSLVFPTAGSDGIRYMITGVSGVVNSITVNYA